MWWSKKKVCEHTWEHQGVHLYGLHSDPAFRAPFFFVCALCGISELRSVDAKGRSYEQYLEEQYLEEQYLEEQFASEEFILDRGIR